VYEFGLRHDLATELYIAPSSSPLVLLPYEEVHLTRIIQEALNNVRKHAQASRVQMAVIPNGRKLTLRVEDDGAGFDPEDGQSRQGRYGMSTMRERAELLGGGLHIQSAPGLGTMITVEIERETTTQG
jgi:signal transduction histidine kinase